uniref:N-acetyltransferase domain-containing protein n=1 Tax=Xenopus tropicalis TaxID=8364 RepID=A0A803J874_XENTR
MGRLFPQSLLWRLTKNLEEFQLTQVAMSEKTLSSMKIIPATASDYNELMSISKGIYRGVDPLPFRYHEWLADPQRKMFVAKSEGKVVGFLLFVLVDGGRTAVSDSLRVAPWMRGHGIARAMQQFCLDNLRSNHPEVSRILFVEASETPQRELTQYQHIHSKAIISISIPYEQMEEKIKLLEGRLEGVGGRRPVVALSPSEVLCLFEDPCTTEGLLPKGLLIHSWIPYSTHRSNLEMLLKRGVVWFYSQHSDSVSECVTSPRSSDASEICIGTNITKSSTSDYFTAQQEPFAPNPVPLPHSSSQPSPLARTSCGFLSLGCSPFPVPLGQGIYCFDIDLFGTDPVSAQTHVLHQLIEMQRVLPAGGGVVCYLFAEKSLRAELTQFCQGLEPFYEVTEQHVLETESYTVIPKSLM